jgi:hypothetical protein
MPLPNKFQRCRAKAKHSQIQCLNPAAYGCGTCRMHGARKPASIKRGADHPMFKHGMATIEANAEHKAVRADLRKIERIMEKWSIGSGPKLRGRKS